MLTKETNRNCTVVFYLCCSSVYIVYKIYITCYIIIKNCMYNKFSIISCIYIDSSSLNNIESSKCNQVTCFFIHTTIFPYLVKDFKKPSFKNSFTRILLTNFVLLPTPTCFFVNVFLAMLYSYDIYLLIFHIIFIDETLVPFQNTSSWLKMLIFLSGFNRRS